MCLGISLDNKLLEKMNEPLLIAVSDLHLSSVAPTFRSAEPDWWAAQARSLRWLKQLQKQLNCPIVIAGDIFDKSMGDSRLVNFAADNLPFSYAIAGNHDLPYHNIDNVQHAAYGNLIRTKSIVNIEDTVRLAVKGVSIVLHGFWYNRPFYPLQSRTADVHIAVVHAYVWAREFGYNNVPEECHSDYIKKQLAGYDYYIFGDNHIPFIEGNLVNCGSFYRRIKGHDDFQPIAAVLYRNRIELVSVPTDEDIGGSKDIDKKQMQSYDFSEFFQSLRQSESLMLDVGELLQNYLALCTVTDDVKHAVLEITA